MTDLELNEIESEALEHRREHGDHISGFTLLLVLEARRLKSGWAKREDEWSDAIEPIRDALRKHHPKSKSDGFYGELLVEALRALATVPRPH